MKKRKFEIDGIPIDIKIRENEKGVYEFYMPTSVTGDYKKIGGYDPKVGMLNPKMREDKIQFKENTIENEALSQIKDQLNSLSDEEIKEEAEITRINDQLDKYAKEHEIGEIERAALYELDEELYDEEVIDEEKEEQKDREEEEEELEPEEQEQTTIKDVYIHEESDLSESVNGIKTLRNWLGGNIPNEFKKVGVIEATDMDEMKDKNGKRYDNISSRYDLVLIDNYGNIRPLKEFVNIEQSAAHGTNSNATERGDAQAENDGRANYANDNTKNDGATVLTTPDGKVLQISMKEHGDIAMYAGKEENGSREFASVQIRGRNDAFESNREEKESVIGQYDGQYSSDEANQESRGHNDEHGNDCKDKTWEDINGSPDKSHSHPEKYIDHDKHISDKEATVVIDEEFIDKAAELMLKDDDKSGEVYNKEDAKNKIREALIDNHIKVGEKYNASDTKEIFEKVNEDIEKEADGQKVKGSQDA